MQTGSTVREKFSYSNVIVFLFDVLGTKALSKPEEFEDLKKAIDESIEKADFWFHDKEEDKAYLGSWTFSDNICYVMEEDEGSYGLGVQLVSLFQMEMLTRGYLVRGAVALGNVVGDAKTILGTGLTAAYLKDSSAIPGGAIAVDESFLPALYKYSKDYPKNDNLITSDLILSSWGGGEICINFARIASEFVFSDMKLNEGGQQFFQSAINEIVKQSNKVFGDPKLEQKWLWAASLILQELKQISCSTRTDLSTPAWNCFSPAQQGCITWIENALEPVDGETHLNLASKTS